MSDVPAGPIPGSYWVEPGRLAAGEYPGELDTRATATRLALIRAAGVDFFLDLTEEGELPPYEPHLEGVAYRRMSVRDFSCPSVEEMRAVLDAIDAALDAGHCVYLHCWGGIGRTGTVVGCWLVRHGLTPADALALIAERRQDSPNAHRRSPETDEQHGFVHAWDEQRG